MDLTSIDSILELIKGINPILLIIGYFLFKDKIDALFVKKPVVPPVVDPTVPVVPVVPVTPVVPSPHPLVDTIISQILPALLPMIIKLIQDQVKLSKEADKV